MKTADHLHPRDGDTAHTAGISAVDASAALETSLSTSNASVPVATRARSGAAHYSRAASRGWLIALPVIAISSGIAYAVPATPVPANAAIHSRMEAYRYALLLAPSGASPVVSSGARDVYGLGPFGPGSAAKVNKVSSPLTPSSLRPRTVASHREVAQQEGPVRRRSTRTTMPFALERVIIGAEVVEVQALPQNLPLLETKVLASVQPLRATTPGAKAGSTPAGRMTPVSNAVGAEATARSTYNKSLAMPTAHAMPALPALQPQPVKAPVATAPAAKAPAVKTPVVLAALLQTPRPIPAPAKAAAFKTVLPRSTFAASRFEGAAMRVMRPQGTQWLQFAGERSPQTGALAQLISSSTPATPAMEETAAQNALQALPAPPAQDAAEATRGMRKVVSALKIPAASQPLSPWMQARSIAVDKIAAAPVRAAQNPDAPPLRQPAAPVTNSDRLPNQLEVSSGTFVVLLTTTDLSTVAIADPSVADVAIVNSRSVLVNGKAPGVTSLVIVDKTRIRQYQVRVSPGQGTRPADVAAAIGLPGVGVRPLRDALVLEGEVESTEEMRRALEIAGVFSPKIVNQLTIRGAVSPEANLATQIQNAINLPNVTVRTIGDTVVLDGTVENAAQRQRAESVANALGKKTLNLIVLPSLTLDQVRESIGALPAAASPEITGIRVRQAGDQIILEGLAANQAFIDQAVSTAARSGLQVVNRVQIMPAITPEALLLNNITAAINIPGVRAMGSAKRLVLQGQVADTNAAVQAEQIARAYASEVDNMLVTANPINVNVDVALVEINKNDLRNLGVTFTNFLDGAANPVGFVLSEGTAGGTPGLVTANAGPTPGLPELRTRSPLQASIRAVIDNGKARLLSNPNTTVLSGRTATFQVGGQVPIPGSTTVTNSGSTTAIIFKDFGVLVDVVPSARLDGVVTMRVRTEVSQPDFTLGVTPPGGGSPIPGFQRRSAVTEVTVRPGGTIALAGLIQNNSRQLIRRVPLLSKLPVLGALFTSKRFQNDETELAIFVTPRVLPNPLTAGQVAPAAPVPAGNTTNVSTMTGNPGISSFNTGGVFTSPGVGGN